MLLLAGQKAGHLGAANRACALSHPAAIRGFFDSSILNGSSLPAFDTVTFEFHWITSWGNVQTAKRNFIDSKVLAAVCLGDWPIFISGLFTFCQSFRYL
jgi:hypothetical protein